jgi:DMSO/TMAO reductase YedYZ molybdopterin-dependent catalytic subunit
MDSGHFISKGTVAFHSRHRILIAPGLAGSYLYLMSGSSIVEDDGNDLCEAHSMNWQATKRRYQAGLWAIPLALFPAFVFSALFGQPSAIEPLVELFFAYTPLPLANLLLNLLGPVARTLALLGAIALLMLAGGLLGLVAPSTFEQKAFARTNRFRWLSVTVATLGGGIVLAKAAGTPISSLAAVLASLLFVPALLWTRTWGRAKPSLAGRRRLLRSLRGTPLALGTILALSTYELWSTLAVQVFSLGNQVRQLFPFTAPQPRGANFPVKGMEPEVTPVAQFYVNGKNATDPLLPAENWELRISGLVRNPATLTYAQLLALPRTDLYATMRCVDNPVDGHLMSTALWSGVRVAELLTLVQPLPTATTLVFHAADQFDEPLALSALVPDAALLVYAMNGETLTQAHGAPVRGLLPGWYGFRNVKWLQALELTAQIPQGYWERTGWTARQIHPVARIDVAQVLDETHVLVAGVAFGGLAGVSAVQVRVDAGPWETATLNAPPLSAYSWVQWRVLMITAAQTFHLTARMIDAAGIAQGEQAQPVYPGGSSGLHTIEVRR